MDDVYKNKILNLAIYAGEIMMKSGAEIYRVEDTIIRICTACGIKTTEVFSTPSGIFVSLNSGDMTAPTFTYIKRIKGQVTDLNKISLVNEFSRTFTTTDMSVDSGMEELKMIDSKRPYSEPIRLLGAAMVAGFFSVIFGGGLTDALVAGVAGASSYALSVFLSKYDINFFIRSLLCTAVAAVIALCAVSMLPGASYQPILIGTIMIYVPGVAITNSIRDFLSGDMIAGLARMADAVITAASIAVGSGIVLTLWHLLGGGM